MNKTFCCKKYQTTFGDDHNFIVSYRDNKLFASLIGYGIEYQLKDLYALHKEKVLETIDVLTAHNIITVNYGVEYIAEMKKK